MNLATISDSTVRKLEALAALIQAETHDELCKRYPEQAREFWAKDAATRIKYGRKYANVDVGTSGKYMVDLATEEIFGVKAYGVIHRGHKFGTLDTIHEWRWGGYRAGRKE